MWYSFFLFSTFLNGLGLLAPDANTASQQGQEALKQLLQKLNTVENIQYKYSRHIRYFSEDYQGSLSGNVYVEFMSRDTLIGFKFQLESEQYKMVFNGTEQFSLDKKKQSLKVKARPKLSDFSSLSLFTNSLVTLKNALPAVLADTEIPKTLRDTIVNQRSCYLSMFVLKNKTLNNLGTFSPVSQVRNFYYRIVIDKETYLPLQVIQTNNVATEDYVLTTFTDYLVNANTPAEQSWYFSSYLDHFKMAAEEKPATLIQSNAIAPDWQLNNYDDGQTVSLKGFGGNVVLMVFWIKNCGYGIGVVPQLNAFVSQYKNKKLQVIGINPHDTKEEIHQFYSKYKLAFKTANDTGKVAAAYGIEAFPAIVLLDKKGSVLYAGGFDRQVIESLSNKAL